MISAQEMSAVLELAQRARKSQAEAMWLEALVNRLNEKIAQAARPPGQVVGSPPAESKG